MKKIKTWHAIVCKMKFKKTVLTMKLIVMLLTIFSLQMSAKVVSQTYVNADFKDASLREVFKEIKKQTGVYFMFNERTLSREISVTANIKNLEVEKSLEKIFKDLPYVYRKIDNYYLIKEKKDDKKDDKKGKKAIKIKGKVTGKGGTPIPGVTVVIKGTTLGISTDIAGKFEIEVKNSDNVYLVFSFVGMQQQTVKYTGKDINVVLEEETSELDEVVITGYQRIEKRKLSSSVISVKGEDIKESGAITVDNMLQGKLAGVNVINSTSTLGAAPKIRIRGASSISGNREPVWVVDGIIIEDPVPISAEELNSLDKVNLIGNAISSINPEDIDRIDVLKDASATAIYGVKAANGVIVITTKKGRYGKPRVNYSNNFSIKMRPSYNKLHRMNSKERIDVSREIAERGLQYSIKPSNIAYEGALYDLYTKKITQDEFVDRVYRLETVNTDWYDELFRTALTQKHAISMSGADDKVNYYFSGGYTNGNDLVKGSDLKSYNAMLKLNINLLNNLSVGFQVRAFSSEKNYLHSSIDPYGYAYNTSRAIPIYNTDGSYSLYNKDQVYESIIGYNILNERDNSGRNIKNRNIDFSANISYRIFQNLTFNGLLAASRSNTKESKWAGEETYYISKLRGVNYGEEIPNDPYFKNNHCILPYGGELSNNNTSLSTYSFRGSLAYNKHFSEVHEFSTNVGTEVRSSTYDGVATIQRGYLPGRGKTFAQIDPVEFAKYKEWQIDNPDKITDRTTNVMSFYGTATYTYDNRYSFNFNIRADGSNKFGQDKKNKFLPVWSVSSRWNIQNESIFKNLMWMNSLALKASYGVQGNVHPDQTPYLLVKMNGMDAKSKEYISSLNKLPNPNLVWEKTKSYNIGIDYALFDNRISGSLEYYNKKGEDQVISKRVSSVTGKSDVTINGGTVENSGYEMSLNIVPVKLKDFTWGISLNAYKNFNEVTSTDQSSTYDYKAFLQGKLVVEGKPLNGFYSYKFKGLDAEGLPTFIDVNEKEVDAETGEVTKTYSKDEMFAKAFEYSGKRVADVNGGFSTFLNYKRFTLNMLFSFSLGKKVRLNNLYKSSGQTLPLPQQNMSDIFVNRWKKGINEDTNIPTLSNRTLKYSDFDRKYTISDNKWEMYDNSNLRVVSGDFLRLRNVSLRYSLGEDLCKKMRISSASIMFDVSNLWLLADKKLRGQDPEQISFGTGTVPPAKGFNIGLNVAF